MKNEDSGQSLADGAKARFGSAVRTHRLAHGLTQEGLAARMTALSVPMTQTTVAKLERGDRPTPIGEAAVLAHILGVSVANLLALDDAAEDAAALALQSAECRRLVRIVQEQEKVIGAATWQLLSAQDELRTLADSMKVDLSSSHADTFGTREKLMHYAITLANPVRQAEASQEAYRNQASGDQHG